MSLFCTQINSHIVLLLGQFISFPPSKVGLDGKILYGRFSEDQPGSIWAELFLQSFDHKMKSRTQLALGQSFRVETYCSDTYRYPLLFTTVDFFLFILLSYHRNQDWENMLGTLAEGAKGMGMQIPCNMLHGARYQWTQNTWRSW